MYYAEIYHFMTNIKIIICLSFTLANKTVKYISHSLLIQITIDTIDMIYFLLNLLLAFIIIFINEIYLRWESIVMYV